MLTLTRTNQRLGRSSRIFSGTFRLKLVIRTGARHVLAVIFCHTSSINNWVRNRVHMRSFTFLAASRSRVRI